MAKQMPKVYYGLHFVTGVAQYSDDKDRIYIGEECAKKMDTTFAGKPVYVKHKEVNLEKLQEEADGYVVESFFNPLDGKHWAKFVVVSDAGHEAIMNGWKLSNAYTINKTGEGGRNHNIEFQCEVLDAEYNHLAIVQEPRYEESVIMTPEDFKKYNLSKENELKVLTNSKEKPINQVKEKIMFKFFTKKEVENSVDIENASVVLKNGKEVSVKDLVDLANAKNESEEKEAKEKEEKELEEKKNAAEKEAKEKEEKENSEKEAKEKAEKEEAEKKNAAEKEAKEKEEKMNEIKNAMESQAKVEVVDISVNKIARGQRLYGSNTK